MSILVAVVGAAGVSVVGARVQQPVAAPAAGSPTPGLNEACGGRSQKPTEACANDVTKMTAMVATLPDKPPAAPLKARKVLIFSRIPTLGDAYQHSSIPLAARTIEEIGKRTGAWTSVISWDVNDMTADKLKQYDAIFLSSTTGMFLDDPNDASVTAARRAALLEFIRGGKGIAGIHATGDSYHGYARGQSPPQSPSPGGRVPPCAVRESMRQPGGGGNPLWPEWDQIIGGYFKFHWSYPTAITVRIDDPKNPVNAPFKGKSFNTRDEVYTFNETSFSRDNVHVLTSIDYALMTDCDKGLEEFPRTDHDYALSWIRREGQGRLFYEALGHHESMYYNNPDLLAHLLAGMQYALGDLKADDTPSGHKK
jgi:type 1 glutamine amidotransferase